MQYYIKNAHQFLLSAVSEVEQLYADSFSRYVTIVIVIYDGCLYNNNNIIIIN